METLERYRQAVLTVLTPAPGSRYVYDEIEETVVADTAKERYLLVRTGWHEGENFYSVIMDVHLAGGKVIVHQNNTEYELVEELVAEGVAEADIVLAYVAPEYRAFV